MKRKTILTILTLALGFLGLQAQTTWNFTTLSDADATLLSADNTGNWTKDSNNRWCYITKLTNSPLVANGSELAWGKDLLFSCNAGEAGNLRIDPAKGRGWIGGSGVISVWANVEPKLCHDLVQHYLDGDYQGSLAMQLEGLDLVHALFCEVNPIPVKAALAKMGLIEESYRMPLCPMAPATRARLESVMKERGLIG